MCKHPSPSPSPRPHPSPSPPSPPVGPVGLVPEQYHLALGADPTSVIVDFVTSISWGKFSQCEWSPVEHGAYGHASQGQARTYTDGGWTGMLHRVVLSGLEPAALFWCVLMAFVHVCILYQCLEFGVSASAHVSADSSDFGLITLSFVMQCDSKIRYRCCSSVPDADGRGCGPAAKAFKGRTVPPVGHLPVTIAAIADLGENCLRSDGGW